MKKHLLLIATLLFSSFIFSQTRGITYQAVLYNPGTNNMALPGLPSQPLPLVNKALCLRFDITDVNSNVIYSEKHATTTDQFGMVNLIIGNGDKIGGSAASFDSIDWNRQANALVVLLDNTANCSNFIQVSNQPFTATPFSLGSKSSSTLVDATNTEKGKIQLAGDLGGTASTPTVPGLALKADITALNSGLATKANTTDVTAALALKADITTLNSSLATKANTTDVTASLTLKANITALDNGLATKANTTDITALNNSLATKANTTDVTASLTLKADITALDNGLATKANTTDVTALNNSLATKANTADVTDALALKANITALDNGLATKANTADVTALNNSLATKANTADVTDALALKANITALDNGLATKANTADVTALNNSLATKANTTDVTASLTLKANITALDNGLATKANTADVTDALALKANITALDNGLALKAPLLSPSLTGTPTAPTAASGTYSTQLATTRFVVDAVSNYVDINSPQTVVGSKSFSGNVRVGSTTPKASAALEVASTTQGFLPPTMTTAQRDLISNPAIGLVVYNTTINCLEWYNGTTWFNSCNTVSPLDSSNSFAVVSAYDCSGVLSGNLKIEESIAGVTKTLVANVTKSGSYSIATNTVNGITFSASGRFTATGNQNIIMTASGTPVVSETTSFTLNTTPNCIFSAVVSGPPLTVISTTTGRIWMDRNLGATRVATSSNDAESFGDLYQWGRGTDGHQLSTSNDRTQTSTNNEPGHGDFILTGLTTPEYTDWLAPGSKNNTLWGGVNGINNPCPSGFRLPTRAELEAEIGEAAGGIERAFELLKLPKVAMRYEYNGNLFIGEGDSFYWTSTISFNEPPKSIMLFLNDDPSYQAEPRKYGAAVRCIKD